MPGTVLPMDLRPVVDVVDEGIAFTRRTGGVSSGPYAGLNLSHRVGDEPAAVAENRRLVSEMLGIDSRWVTVNQVHGPEIHVVRSIGDASEEAAADAIVAGGPATVAVMVADCVPIAVRGDGVFGVIHCGWRSLASGIVERVTNLVSARRAWIGPAIGACHYEVGDEVIAALGDRPVISQPSAEPGKVRLDLSASVGELFRALGVDVAYRSDSCTACESDLFSYRRSAVTGRQAVLMWK